MCLLTVNWCQLLSLGHSQILPRSGWGAPHCHGHKAIPEAAFASPRPAIIFLKLRTLLKNPFPSQKRTEKYAIRAAEEFPLTILSAIRPSKGQRAWLHLALEVTGACLRWKMRESSWNRTKVDQHGMKSHESKFFQFLTPATPPSKLGRGVPG